MWTNNINKKMYNENKVDFVIIWVDDSDPKWRELYKEYSKKLIGDSREIRFRDYGTLKYWFRGIEKFAPWFNKIFFITFGHHPSWLNLSNPRLRCINHRDYIPLEWLPTFNSTTIELNFHRIAELSERFVYFNDDTFVINHIGKERFFKKGKPCDIAVINAYQPSGDCSEHIVFNDVGLINSYFNKRKILKNNFSQWFNLKYGTNVLRTIALFPYPRFNGFLDPHLPNAFLKSSFEKVWQIYNEPLEQSCKSKFRETHNLNQYLIRYYQLVSGCFHPINPMKTSISYPEMNDEIFTNALNDIINQKKPIICINDGKVEDFIRAKSLLIKSFETILPEKSSFEI